MLDGKFAFVVNDTKHNRIYAARDHMGICPMYIAYGKDGSIWFASEMKVRKAAAQHGARGTAPSDQFVNARAPRVCSCCRSWLLLFSGRVGCLCASAVLCERAAHREVRGLPSGSLLLRRPRHSQRPGAPVFRASAPALPSMLMLSRSR